MKLVVNTGPTIEPITLLELKNHLKIDVGTLADSAQEDTVLNSLIKASRKHVENITRRRLVSQTWDYYLDGWPCEDYIKIPFGNLSATVAVTYYDSTGGSTTFGQAVAGGSTGYDIEQNGEGIGRLVLAYNADWPTETLRPSHPVKITFKCGYGTAASSVPDDLRVAIMFRCQNIWRHGGEHEQVSKIVNDLSYNYRLWDEFS